MLKTAFLNLVSKYSKNQELIIDLWKEIEKAYSSKNRHYHNLNHLENLISELEETKPLIKNWDCILFSVFYHDFIYKPLKSDNEEKSALFAIRNLEKLNVSTELIDTCKEQIIATKSHKISTNEDTNFFTDADLSVLGKEWEVYEMYFQNVRREYSIFPDIIYKPGRIKVLKHFLEMARIYKTDFFYQKYETDAKRNLKRELDFLNED